MRTISPPTSSAFSGTAYRSSIVACPGRVFVVIYFGINESEKTGLTVALGSGPIASVAFVYDVAPGGFEELEQFVAGDQHFALTGHTERFELALTNIRANTGLAQLQIICRLLYGQKVTALRIHYGYMLPHHRYGQATRAADLGLL